MITETKERRTMSKTGTIALTNGSAVTIHLIDMVKINAGTFLMGSPAHELVRFNNETQHEVTLTKDFYMGKYQVTQEQYAAVMGFNPSSFKESLCMDNPAKHPVEMVSWYDALVFCNKLSVMEGLTPAYSILDSADPHDWGTAPASSDAAWNKAVISGGSNGYRLPTEAQWEYACRAGSTVAYHTGVPLGDDAGWYSGNSGSRTHEAGLKTPNAWGLYDMHGNVNEWCGDWYSADYGVPDGAAQTDPAGASSGSSRILRGGGWISYARFMRSAYRGHGTPSGRGFSLGFRLVRP